MQICSKKSECAKRLGLFCFARRTRIDTFENFPHKFVEIAFEKFLVR